MPLTLRSSAAWHSRSIRRAPSLIRTQVRAQAMTHHGSRCTSRPQIHFRLFPIPNSFALTLPIHTRHPLVDSESCMTTHRHTDTHVRKRAIVFCKQSLGSSKVLAQANANSIVDEPLSSRYHMCSGCKFDCDDAPFASPAHALLSSRLIFTQPIQ